MQQYAQEFMRYLQANGVRYTESDDNVINIAYCGQNLETVEVYVFFDDDGEPFVQFRCWDIANFKEDPDAAIVMCNDLNAAYRWVKFFPDEDGDIIATIDTMIDINTCGYICLSLVQRMVSIIDEAYPEIERYL